MLWRCVAKKSHIILEIDGVAGSGKQSSVLIGMSPFCDVAIHDDIGTVLWLGFGLFVLILGFDLDIVVPSSGICFISVGILLPSHAKGTLAGLSKYYAEFLRS